MNEILMDYKQQKSIRKVEEGCGCGGGGSGGGGGGVGGADGGVGATILSRLMTPNSAPEVLKCPPRVL